MITSRLGSALLASALFGLVALACSSSDTTTPTSSSSTSGAPSGSSSGASSGAGSSSSSSGAGCTTESCPKLKCTCGILAGAEVQKCSNGTCATTCEQAGCK